MFPKKLSDTTSVQKIDDHSNDPIDAQKQENNYFSATVELKNIKDKPTSIKIGKRRFQAKEDRSRKNSIFRALITAKKRLKFIFITPLMNDQLI